MEVLADRNYFFALMICHFHILKELVSNHLKSIFRPRLNTNNAKLVINIKQTTISLTGNSMGEEGLSHEAGKLHCNNIKTLLER